MRKIISIDLKPYDWSKDVKNIQARSSWPLAMPTVHDMSMHWSYFTKGVGKMGDIHGLPQSRLAIIPGTAHIGMIQRTSWLIPMVIDFLDSNLNATPPKF